MIIEKKTKIMNYKRLILFDLWDFSFFCFVLFFTEWRARIGVWLLLSFEWQQEVLFLKYFLHSVSGDWYLFDLKNLWWTLFSDSNVRTAPEYFIGLLLCHPEKVQYYLRLQLSSVCQELPNTYLIHLLCIYLLTAYISQKVVLFSWNKIVIAILQLNIKYWRHLFNMQIPTKRNQRTVHNTRKEKTKQGKK